MRIKGLKLGLCCGIAVPLLFFISWGLISGFMTPLPSPEDTPAELRAFYGDNTTAIRIGLMITIGCSVLLAPFFGSMTSILKRIEGRDSPFTWGVVMIGATWMLEFIFPMLLYAVAAFRPDRNPDSLLLISDISWILFIGAWSSVPALEALIGLIVIMDRAKRPLLPRWYAYYSFWAALLMCGGAFLIFFKNGPLAWNGLLSFWIPAVDFGTWFGVTFYVFWKALRQVEVEEAGQEMGEGIEAAALATGNPAAPT